MCFAASVTLAESISDGEWHLLHWRILGTKITFKVDDIASSLDLQFDIFNGDRSSEIVLYIGARPFVPGVHSFLYRAYFISFLHYNVPEVAIYNNVIAQFTIQCG